MGCEPGDALAFIELHTLQLMVRIWAVAETNDGPIYWLLLGLYP